MHPGMREPKAYGQAVRRLEQYLGKGPAFFVQRYVQGVIHDANTSMGSDTGIDRAFGVISKGLEGLANIPLEPPMQPKTLTIPEDVKDEVSAIYGVMINAGLTEKAGSLKVRTINDRIDFQP